VRTSPCRGPSTNRMPAPGCQTPAVCRTEPSQPLTMARLRISSHTSPLDNSESINYGDTSPNLRFPIFPPGLHSETFWEQDLPIVKAQEPAKGDNNVLPDDKHVSDGEDVSDSELLYDDEPLLGAAPAHGNPRSRRQRLELGKAERVALLGSVRHLSLHSR